MSISNNKKLIILDRDGVINQLSKYYVIRKRDFIFIKNSLLAISNLSKHKYYISIATNQSCVGRKFISKNQLEELHFTIKKKLRRLGISLYHFAYCPHHPLNNCFCRKPKTGLIDEILKVNYFKFSEKWLIGDNITDLLAFELRNFNLILVKTGLGEKNLKRVKKYSFSNLYICEDLKEASELILNYNKKSNFFL